MKVCFLDMDGVLTDFDGYMRHLRGCEYIPENDPPEMFRGGFFRNLPPMPGAIQAVSDLERLGVRLYIATKPTTKNLYCASEKMLWVERFLPTLLKRMLIVCDKGLLRGDYLIDDDHEDRWRHSFQGEFIKFDPMHPQVSWRAAVERIRSDLRA